MWQLCSYMGQDSWFSEGEKAEKPGECVRQSEFCPAVPKEIKSFPGVAVLTCETIHGPLCLAITSTGDCSLHHCLQSHTYSSHRKLSEGVKRKASLLYLCSLQWFSNKYLLLQLNCIITGTCCIIVITKIKVLHTLWKIKGI